MGVGGGYGAEGRYGELFWRAAERDKVALDTNRLHYGDITLKASFHHTPATCRRAFELVTSGRFKCAEYITGRAGLDEVPAVFAAMMSRAAMKDIKTAILPAGAPR